MRKITMVTFIFVIIVSCFSINSKNDLENITENNYINEELIKSNVENEESENDIKKTPIIINHYSEYGKGEYIQPNIKQSFLLKNTLVFSYKAKKGETISITATNITKSFFSFLTVYDANGKIVAVDNDENKDFISKVEYQATYEGDYSFYINPVNYSYDFNKTGEIDILVQNNLEKVVEDIPIHFLEKGNFHQISELNKNQYKKTFYKTEGYITKINNCFCPVEEYCKICSPNMIISENQNESDKKSILVYLGSFSHEEFTLYEKYKFTLMVKNESNTDEPRNSFIIDSFEKITK